MRTSLLPQPLVWLLLATLTSAQRVVDDISFGHKGGPISPNSRNIPGWRTSSINHNLQIMSDRVILTPPVPGNARGALWSESPIQSETWNAEVEFRASGQETGSGNLQFWFVKDRDTVNIDSVYSVGNIDGLAIVIDQYGQSAGKIRGFLNDGGQNFRSHGRLASLAFGHCDYAYRNLGRPSKLRVSSHDGLKVTIDDQDCFSSDKISLPSGYFFGLTSGTADQPDSFEIQKFIVSDTIPHEHLHTQKGGAPPQGGEIPTLQKLDRFPGSPEAMPDRMAEDIKSQDEQFADLHNRMQSLTHQIANLFAEINQLGYKLDGRHDQLVRNVPSSLLDRLDSMNRKMENMERNIEQVKRDVEGKDYREHLNQLNQAIESVKGGLTDSLPENIGQSMCCVISFLVFGIVLTMSCVVISASAPRMGMFVFVIVAVQVMMAGAYIVYKRRRATMPKKYL